MIPREAYSNKRNRQKTHSTLRNAFAHFSSPWAMGAEFISGRGGEASFLQLLRALASDGGQADGPLATKLILAGRRGSLPELLNSLARECLRLLLQSLGDSVAILKGRTVTLKSGGECNYLG